MPTSRFILPPLDLGNQSLGQRIAQLRKEQGLTQTELADKIGIIQALISDYERDRRRLHAEMIIRVAQALNVTADELLGMKRTTHDGSRKLSLKLTRRLNKIESLPPVQQKTLLQTIDTFLKAEKR